jgi:hypothetical protein
MKTKQGGVYLTDGNLSIRRPRGLETYWYTFKCSLLPQIVLILSLALDGHMLLGLLAAGPFYCIWDV